jgi:hypothetical protein
MWLHIVFVHAPKLHALRITMPAEALDSEVSSAWLSDSQTRTLKLEKQRCKFF